MDTLLDKLVYPIVTAVIISILGFVWVYVRKYGTEAWKVAGSKPASVRTVLLFLIGILVALTPLLILLSRPVDVVSYFSMEGIQAQDNNKYVIEVPCTRETSSISGGCIILDASIGARYLTGSGILNNKNTQESGYYCHYAGGPMKRGDAEAFVECADRSRIRWIGDRPR